MLCKKSFVVIVDESMLQVNCLRREGVPKWCMFACVLCVHMGTSVWDDKSIYL